MIYLESQTCKLSVAKPGFPGPSDFDVRFFFEASASRRPFSSSADFVALGFIPASSFCKIANASFRRVKAQQTLFLRPDRRLSAVPAVTRERFFVRPIPILYRMRGFLLGIFSPCFLQVTIRVQLSLRLSYCKTMAYLDRQFAKPRILAA